MNLERQRQILKEKHDLALVAHNYLTHGPTRLTVSESESDALATTGDLIPRYECWAWVGSLHCVFVNTPAGIKGFRGRTLHNFVAAVTYAKAELARIERLVAAKENQ